MDSKMFRLSAVPLVSQFSPKKIREKENKRLISTDVFEKRQLFGTWSLRQILRNCAPRALETRPSSVKVAI